MILSLLRLILYIFQTANSLLFGTSVYVFYYWYNNNIISQLHSSQSRQIFFEYLCVSEKNWRKKYLIIISIKFLRGMWIFLLLSLKHFSLEQGKSWLATFASLKLARPFLMKPPKSILYLCRIVAHNGLKTKNNKNKPDWNTNFTPKLFKIEIIYWTIFPFLSQHTSGAKCTNV